MYHEPREENRYRMIIMAVALQASQSRNFLLAVASQVIAVVMQNYRTNCNHKSNSSHNKV
jgi:hypothetical protein